MSVIDTSSFAELANSPYALLILSSLSFSESAFFIIPPEVLLIPMALINPQLALIYGTVTTLTSVAGAATGYGIGKKGGKPILYKIFSEEKIETVRTMFHRYDSKAILISAFTPIPFKIFTIAAGVFDIDFAKFMLASLVGRGTRYMLIAGLIAVYGESIRYFIEHQLDKALAIFTIGGIVLFAFYKFGIPYVEQKFLKATIKDKFLELIGR